MTARSLRERLAALGRGARALLARVPSPRARAFWAAFGLCWLALWSTPVAVAALLGLIVLVFVDGALCGREAPLELSVALPRRLGQGQRTKVCVDLFDPGLRARSFELSIAGDPALFAPAAYEVRSGVSSPRRRLEFPFEVHALLRGPRELSALHLRVAGPLGLAWHRARVPVGRGTLVVPGLREVLAHQSRAALHMRRGLGRRQSRQRGEGGSFESLREYARGDDPRHLDWKATARRALPMVRRYEAERSQNVVLVLDCGRLMAERFDHLERLDHALAAAVVLTRVAESWRDNVGLMAFADSVSRVLSPGAFPSSRLIDELSALEARPVEPDYPRALLQLSRELRRRSLIVVFTDLVDGEVSEPLAAHLAILARRHLPLLVALRNPALFEAAAATPADTEAAYRRAAATELVEARRASLERLRRAGVQVVDIDPSQSITAAVDAYLEIKLRGRL